MPHIILTIFLLVLLNSSNHVSASSALVWQDGTNQIVSSQAQVTVLNDTVLLHNTTTQRHLPLIAITNNIHNEIDLNKEQGNRANATLIGYQDKAFLIGGMDNQQPSALVNWLQLDKNNNVIDIGKLPPLPQATHQSTAIVRDDVLYVMALSAQQLHFYRIRLLPSSGNSDWEILEAPSVSGPISTLLLSQQNDGQERKFYAYIKGQDANLWEYSALKSTASSGWQRLKTHSLPHEEFVSLHKLGQAHLLALTPSGISYHYNTISKAWARYKQQGAVPKALKHSVLINHELFVVAGNEQTKLYQASINQGVQHFGWLNMSVLILYLAGVVLFGLYFMTRNKNTNDFFRGGQSIPWWAAACSIYATMLSSLTYMALPALVYQSNWVLLIGILTIVAVAPIAVYVAIPFFRQIDATSAYEYLSKRFNLTIRLLASSLFTLFHLGRMGVVMALTALALSAITPLSATESVLLMGVLCLIYCTLGGIEAVIWTDTMQTIVLLIGAILCFAVILAGVDGGFSTFVEVGFADDKFKLFNADFSPGSITTLSIWVVVLGGIGQNLSSYTADQAVVQRYMVTPDVNAAKKSIWTNAIIAAPASLLFFCIGTGLYVFYQANPAELDPIQQIDQIFPAFIATQMPVGLAGLIVAGIFAAAQSTVSTSMNSISTTLVTDFVRPFNLVKTEKGYMRTAQILTFSVGVLATLIGLIFIDPRIRSLMDAYFMIIGMFMGALGGLFVLGAISEKANAIGAAAGLIGGVSIMIICWQFQLANGYLYGSIGIVSCVVIGYTVSRLAPTASKDIQGLTLSTLGMSSNQLK